MKKLLLLTILLFVSFQVQPQSEDQLAIEQTLNNYIDGFYKGDANKLKVALKPRLYKFGYWKNKDTGDYEYYQQMTFDQAIAFVEKMKAEGKSRDENKIRKAEVLDIGNHIASAKITAAWGVDYVLLSKDEGKWMIEQVIWEGPYIAEESKSSVTTYYLIRHAEKDRSDASNKNPELTKKGRERALNWVNTFKDIPLDAVYSTNYKRTMQTAEPTATSQGLEIINYHPGNMDMNAFFKATEGKQVLIVGHSNTTPYFANALVGKRNTKIWMTTTIAASILLQLQKTQKALF